MTDEHSPLRNIGEQTLSRLHEIGIFTRTDIARLGVVETYRRLKRTFPKHVTLNALWGLEPALLDIDWRAIPNERKDELKAELHALENSP